ncbi:MAG: hypothetical protein IJK89_07405 [Clostridia bacterium]|nr:hypothetical protein [Clostridia bacterium]
MKKTSAGKTADLLKKKDGLTVIDAAALLLFAGFAVYYLLQCRTASYIVDEGYYLTIPHRFLMGDKPFTEEWHVSQLTALLQMLPFYAYTKLTGGVEGIILWNRYLAVICHLCVSVYLYLHLRKERLAGLFASVMFCSYFCFNIYQLCYNTICIMSLTVLCCVLFLKEKPNAFQTVFAGVILSCLVLSEPLLAFLYVFYTAAVIVRAVGLKKGKDRFGGAAFLINSRTWRLLSAGIAPCLAGTLYFVFSRVSLGEIFAVLPELFTDPEYNFSVTSGNMLDPVQIMAVVDCYTPYFLVFAAAAFCLCLTVLKKKNQRAGMILASLTTAAAFAVSVVNWMFFEDACFLRMYRAVPLLFFGIVCYAYTRNREKRLLVFWGSTLVATLIVDYASAWSIALCAPAAMIPSVLMISRYLRELKSEQTAPTKKKSRDKAGISARSVTACLMSVVCCALVTESLWNSVFFDLLVTENVRHPTEVMTEGPLKGLKTTAETKRDYTLILKDLDVIKETCTGPVYIMSLNSWYYLYLDLPYATFSTWYEDNDWARQTRYFELFENRVPEYVYIPKANGFNIISEDKKAYLYDDKIEFLDGLFDYTLTDGKAGFIIHVNGKTKR